MIGIYKIENLINHKIYIGQAVDIKARWRGHNFSARHEEDRDHHLPIHLAMAKYGLENFSYEVLEECSKNELNDKEIYWIDYYNSYYKGYNATKGGNNNFEHLGCPILAYDMNGNFIKEYPNAAILAREINRSYSVVRQVLNKDRKSCANLQLKFKDDTNTIIIKYTNNQGGKKKIRQFDDNDNTIAIYESVNEAARQTGFDSSTISKVCRNKLKHTGGYKWEYM